MQISPMDSWQGLKRSEELHMLFVRTYEEPWSVLRVDWFLIIEFNDLIKN